MNTFNKKLFAIFTLLLLSFFVSSAAALSPYDGAATTDFVVSSTGTSSVSDNFGIIYNIQGAAGSTGTITTEVLTSNPQPTATPEGVTLTHFIVVTFNMDAADFSQAQIIIPYTDSDVQGVQQPYTIYKYMPATDTYTAFDAVVDTNAKTFTITLNSVDDPLFAVGGATVLGETSGFSTTAWVALASSVAIVVILVVVGVWYFKRSP